MKLGGQRGQRIDALDINRKALGLIGNAAVSRSAINLAHARRLPQLPNQRVLAAAASDHQDFHSQTDRLGAEGNYVKQALHLPIRDPRLQLDVRLPTEVRVDS